MKYKKTLQQRFEEKFIKKSPEECWPWIAANRRGYGCIGLNGKLFDAHRLSYELYVGEIPKDLIIRHKCDNRICVNPHHLELGTSIQNVHDAIYRSKTHRCLMFKNMTHCINGHEFNNENTLNYYGNRRCRKCNRINQLRHKYKTKNRISEKINDGGVLL